MRDAETVTKGLGSRPVTISHYNKEENPHYVGRHPGLHWFGPLLVHSVAPVPSLIATLFTQWILL